jgi:teichuronic acid biosynthesis glycosyltransferase TuaG
MERTFVKDLVSVIIPVYNSERFIAKTIDSVLSQTYSNIEIIIVDDCSTDSSEQIIEGYFSPKGVHKRLSLTSNCCQKDKCDTDYSDTLSLNKSCSGSVTTPSVLQTATSPQGEALGIYYRQPTNQGAAVARNKALELAKGQYVAFLDSDDLWKINKLEKQISFMKNNNISFCFSAIEMIDLKGNLVKSKRNVKGKVTYDYLLKNTMIPTSSVVIDRNIVGDFQMPLIRGGQDYATWLMLLRNNIAYGINEAFVQYRIGHSSLSSNKLKSFEQVWNIQTRQEKINKIKAFINLFCFGFNALKKYFL